MKDMTNNPELYTQSGDICPIKVVSNLISGKWKIMILWYLSQEKRRFGEIQKLIPRASKGVLSNQLNELVKDHLIIKTVYNQVPQKVEYSLSDTGKSFISILEVLKVWGNDYIEKHYK